MSNADEGRSVVVEVSTVDSSSLFTPDWPAPSHVKSIISTRECGVSNGVYAQNNVAVHVGDDVKLVQENRKRLLKACGIDAWQWLEQVHGTDVIEASVASCQGAPQADGCTTKIPNLVCSVMTADCLPILMCDQLGQQVAAVHAGWRGLADGIIEKAIDAFDAAPSQILAYIGPAIGKEHFEVGVDVLERFPRYANDILAFSQNIGKFNSYQADLVYLAKQVFRSRGVERLYGGGDCTYADAEQFYSYRRDGQTGRIVSAIWIEQKGRD